MVKTTANKFANWVDHVDMLKLAQSILLIAIMFGLFLNRQETLANRENGYHNRAVSCAAVKGAIQGLATQHTGDAHIIEVYEQECQDVELDFYKTDPQIKVAPK